MVLYGLVPNWPDRPLADGKYLFLIACLWKQTQLGGLFKVVVMKASVPLKSTAEIFAIFISF